MSDHHETCPACGSPISVGDFPFCGGKNNHGKYGGMNVPDSLSGGRGEWIENLDSVPIWIESKSQLRREAAARGLRWDPKPTRGTPPNPEADQRGRFNGGAFPTYRT